MKSELVVDVKVKMDISDETAQTCLGIVQTYCRERLGDLDPGEICRGCGLLSGCYCEYMRCGVVVGGSDEQNND